MLTTRRLPTGRLLLPQTLLRNEETESVTRAIRVTVAEVSPELGMILVAPSTTIDAECLFTS